ncbi:DUF413 domain-containing protein [Thalassotalea eurytherma]|uniref:Macrodomain Ori protein n=1 Tax=Thalassotalea eurytherma TaxID=1144278 RepID=A0ABQ6H6E2_9GAMM|nr:DUF413 domain-containing protein [Thalassotalea eurytherma]GLX82456.1 hypothetical protein theurythT_19080 [Thalassotalea eurytherma]
MSTQNHLQESFQSTRRFYDDKNYPRGINRSGDYSISEVKILEQHGVALQEIANGKRVAVTAEEQQFKAVCDGERSAETKIEKTWLKYQNKVLSPKQFHTLFGTRKVDDDGDNSPTDLEDIEVS